jgi:hypothetical protein
VSHEPPDPFAESLAAHHAKVDADRDAEIAPLKAEYGKLENTCLAWKEANDALKAEVETLKVTRTDLRAQLAESERLRAEAEAAGVISGQAIGRREAAQEVERLANIIEDERQFSADEKARREKAEAALKERDTQLSALRDREAALVEALKERILQNCEEADGSQCEPHWDCSAAHAAIANPTQAGVDWRASVEREAKLEQETCDKQAMLLVLATTGRALGLPLPAEESIAGTMERVYAAVEAPLLARIARLVEALSFYADPGTYHACSFLFDSPTGGFDADFTSGHEDYDRPMPGKAARAALDAERAEGGKP